MKQTFIKPMVAAVALAGVVATTTAHAWTYRSEGSGSYTFITAQGETECESVFATVIFRDSDKKLVRREFAQVVGGLGR